MIRRDLALLLVAFVTLARAQGELRLTATGRRSGEGTDAVDTAFPQGLPFWTGFAKDSAGFVRNSGLVRFVNSMCRGWAKLDLASIPDSAMITAAELRYQCSYTYSGLPATELRALDRDPVMTSNPETLWNALGSGAVVADPLVHDSGWVARTLNAAGIAAVRAGLAQNWVAFALRDTHTATGYGGHAYGYVPLTGRPRLVLTYTVPLDIRAVSAATVSYPLVEGGVDTLSARFSNIGTASSVNTVAYAFRNSVKFDSVIIGSLAPGRDTTVRFTLTTPPCDESRQYFSFVGYDALDGNHANDTVRYDDWSFPVGTYRAEGFDNSGTFPPAGWTWVNGDGGSVLWSRGSGSSHAGVYQASCAFEATRNDDWLVSPRITIDQLAIESLGVHYRANWSTSTDTLEVWAMRGVRPADTLARLSRLTAGSTNYAAARLPLSGYAGQSIYFGFRKLGRSTNVLHLDDLFWMRRPGEDVGITRVLAPRDTVPQGSVVVPRVRVQNHGTTGTSCDVRLIIRRDAGVVYDTTETGLTLDVGESLDYSFSRTWTAMPDGGFTVTAYTILESDIDHTNDTTYASGYVKPLFPGGWSELAGIPLSPSSKTVKDGSWLSFAPWDGRVYGAKGNRCGDFHVYDPPTSRWTTLAPIPAGREGKPQGKGGCGAVGSNGRVYSVKGNGTLGFWRYSAVGDSWFQLSDIPVGGGKKVRGGSDMVCVVRGDTDEVYLLKGLVQEFYRYSNRDSAWIRLADAPAGLRPKWDKGSFLVYDGNGQIYAHKPKVNELWRYNVASRAWSSAPLGGMPTINRAGKRKKVKVGSCAAWFGDAFYAFKGGGSVEFWRYRPSQDSWAELESLPPIGASGRMKSVKAGADLASAEDVIYAFKGNATGEFWQYRTHNLATAANRMPAARPALAGRVLPRASGGVMAVRFGPAQGRQVLTIYDALGRVVLRSASPDGPVAVDVGRLNDGVYLVRVDAGGTSRTEKIVIQH